MGLHFLSFSKRMIEVGICVASEKDQNLFGRVQRLQLKKGGEGRGGKKVGEVLGSCVTAVVVVVRWRALGKSVFSVSVAQELLGFWE